MENNNNQNANPQNPVATEEVVYNTGKGVIVALVAAIAACGGWLLIIRLLGAGLGGAVGGILAAGCGMLIAGGYKMGAGKPGGIGILVAAAFSFVAASIATYIGTGIVLYQAGIGDGTFDALYLLFEERIPGVPSRLFWQDFAFSVGIAVVMGVISSFGGKKKKQD